MLVFTFRHCGKPYISLKWTSRVIFHILYCETWEGRPDWICVNSSFLKKKKKKSEGRPFCLSFCSGARSLDHAQLNQELTPWAWLAQDVNWRFLWKTLITTLYLLCSLQTKHAADSCTLCDSAGQIITWPANALLHGRTFFCSSGYVFSHQQACLIKSLRNMQSRDVSIWHCRCHFKSHFWTVSLLANNL